MLFDKYGMLIREESNDNISRIKSLVGVTFPITTSYQLEMFPSTYSMNSSNPSKSTNYSKFENDRKKIIWYTVADRASWQYNQNGETYYYIALTI